MQRRTTDLRRSIPGFLSSRLSYVFIHLVFAGLLLSSCAVPTTSSSDPDETAAQLPGEDDGGDKGQLITDPTQLPPKDPREFPRFFRLGFQPEGGYWSQGSLVHHNARHEWLLLRPHFGVEQIAYIKQLNPNIQIIGTFDTYLRYVTSHTNSVGGSCNDRDADNHFLQANVMDVACWESPAAFNLVLRRADGVTPVWLSEPFGHAFPNTYEDATHPLKRFNGESAVEYMARRNLEEMFPSGTPVADLAWDGIGHDWFQEGFYSIQDFDYNENGINDFDVGEILVDADNNPIDPISVLREGKEAYLRAMKAEFESVTGRSPVIYKNSGNSSNWLLDEINGVINEGFQLGGNWDQVYNGMQSWSGPDNTNDQFWLFTNKLGGANWENNEIPATCFTGQTYDLNQRKACNYRYMLYGLTLTGMADLAYYDVSSFSEHEKGLATLYDEALVRLGMPISEAIEIPGIAAGRVFARFYDDGVVLHYSGVDAGSAEITITDAQLQALVAEDSSFPYDGPYFRIQGNQNPTVNDGSLFDSVTLQGDASSAATRSIGDGIILVKQAVVAVNDIVVGNYPSSDSSPGQLGATYLPIALAPTVNPADPWAHRSYRAHPTDASQSNPYFNLGPVYNTFSSFGQYFSYGHREALANSGAEAHYRPVIGIECAQFDVYEWHGFIGQTDADNSEATNVPYEFTVSYSDGRPDFSAQGTIDQSQNKGQWNKVLGPVAIPSGRRANFKIKTNGADATVIADAIMFRYVGEEPNCTP